MNYLDIDNFIAEGEGTHVEFKRKVPSPEKIARTVIAFANTRGGNILFGVDDDGSIVGVRSEKEEIELIRYAAGYLAEPPVDDIEIEIIPYKSHRDVVVCRVFESDDKPHKIVSSEPDTGTTGVFIRVKDQTLEASKEVVKVLKDENQSDAPLRLSIGENEKRLFAYLEEYTRITKVEFCDLVNISKRRASRILVTLVRAGVLRIHIHEKEEFYTLVD